MSNIDQILRIIFFPIYDILNMIWNSINFTIDLITYLPLIIAFIIVFVVVIIPEIINLLKETVGEAFIDLFEI